MEAPTVTAPTPAWTVGGYFFNWIYDPCPARLGRGSRWDRSLGGCPPESRVCLSSGMCPPATVRGVAREGFVQLKVALPSLFDIKNVNGHREESADESCGNRDGSTQAVGHDRGHRRTREDP